MLIGQSPCSSGDTLQANQHHGSPPAPSLYIQRTIHTYVHTTYNTHFHTHNNWKLSRCGIASNSIYLRSIIFEILHLGERLKLQMPRGFQDTPFSLLFILANVHPHPLIMFSHSEARHCLTLARVVRSHHTTRTTSNFDRRTTRTSVRQCWLLSD